MSKSKKDYVGSIYCPKGSTFLWLKYRGKKMKTERKDTPENRGILIKYLKEIEKEYQQKKKAEKILFGETNTVDKKRQTIKLSEAFREYLGFRGQFLHKATIKSYEFSKGVLFPEMDFRLVDNEQIFYDVVIDLIRSNKYSRNSINIILRSLQTFLNYCFERNYIKKVNIYNKFKLAVAPKNVQPFTPEEYSKIINYFKRDFINESEQNPKKDIEFANLLEFQLFTGMRIGESLILTFDNIDFDKRVMAVPNKTRKEKINKVALLDNAVKVLSEQKAIASNRTTNRNKVFRWSENTKSRLIRKLNDCLIDLGINISGQAFHRFRNTFAELLVDSGVDIFSVRDMMRHSDINVLLNHYYHKDIFKGKQEFENRFDNFVNYDKKIIKFENEKIS